MERDGSFSWILVGRKRDREFRFANLLAQFVKDTNTFQAETKESLQSGILRIPRLNPPSQVQAIEGQVQHWSPVAGSESKVWWLIREDQFILSSSKNRITALQGKFQKRQSKGMLISNRRFLGVNSVLSTPGSHSGRIVFYANPDYLLKRRFPLPLPVLRSMGISKIVGLGGQFIFRRGHKKNKSDPMNPPVVMELVAKLAEPKGGVWKSLDSPAPLEVPPVITSSVRRFDSVSINWEKLFNEFIKQYEKDYGNQQASALKGQLSSVGIHPKMLLQMDHQIGTMAFDSDRGTFGSSQFFYRKFRSEQIAKNYLEFELRNTNDNLMKRFPVTRQKVNGIKVWMRTDETVQQWYDSSFFNDAYRRQFKVKTLLDNRRVFFVVDNWVLIGSLKKVKESHC